MQTLRLIRQLYLASIAAVVGLLCARPSWSATLYWDGNDTNGNANGGAGTWTNGGSTDWDTLPFGGANSAWTNGDHAVFGSTAGTVTIGSGGVTVGGLLFNTTGYTIAAGSNGLTFSSGDNKVWLSAGLNGSPSATITGLIGGTGANLILVGNPGATATNLTFSGISSGGWTGTTTITGATLTTTTTSGNVNQVLNSTSGITINGGTIQFNRATNAQLNAISDSAAITVNGGGTFGATSADAGGSSANETIGAVTLNSGQLNLNWTNNPSSGGTIILSNFIRSGATSALTVSFGANGRFRNAAVSTDTAANEIIGPWATTGGANGISAQTDYAVFSGGNGTFTAAGIAASAESAWSTTHAATSNYTLQNATGSAANGRLTATRNINTLRNTTAAVNLTSVNTSTDVITVTGSSFSNGDAVTFGGTAAPGGLANNVVYYVVGASGASFQVAATPGGSAIDLTNGGTSPNISGGITLSSGNNLGTFGILNGSAAFLPIGRGSSGGQVTLPTSGAGNLYLTPGSAGIGIDAPIVDNGGALTLVKNGGNGLFLSGANTYTGGTVINAGPLTFSSAGSWVSGQNITFGGTGSIAASVGALTGGTLTVNQGATGSISGSSNITFSTTTGAGNLIYGGGSSATLNIGDASGFTGNALLSMGGIGTNPRPTLRFSSIDDTAGSYIGWGAAGQNDSNQWAQIEFNGATAALVFNSRQIANLGRTSGNNSAKNLILINNNSNAAHTWTINSDFLNHGDRSGQALILEGSNAGNNAFNGVIGNSTVNNAALAVAKNGAGKWILDGANTFTGRLIAGQGTLSVDTLNEATVAGPLGMSNSIQLGGDERSHAGTAVQVRLGTNNSGTLEYTGGAVTSSRSFFIGDSNAAGTGGGTIANNGTGAITFGAATFNSTQTGITATRTLTFAGSNTDANTVQGVIQNNDTSGVINVAKSGTGHWIFSGTNTYTGTTAVSGGSLQIGVGGTGTTGSGAVAVNTSSTILGTGVIRGTSFTAASGSTVHAGDGTGASDYGTLTFTPASGTGTYNFQSGSTTFLGLDTATPSNSDKLLFTNNGTLTFNGNLTVGPSSFTPTSTATFQLLDWGGFGSTSFHSRYNYTGLLLGNGDEAAGFDLPDISGGGGAYKWDISNFTTNGSIAIVLVPEPSALALLGLGACGVFLRRS